jgi:hypothetical protein
MSNIRFSYNNIWDGKTLSYSSQLSNYPAINTQQRWRTYPWRSTGVNIEYIRMEGYSALQANIFVVFNHNFQKNTNSNMRIKGSNDNWATTPLNQAMTKTDDLFIYISPTTLTYDDFGVYMYDVVGNPDGYMEVGRIWMGTYWEPTYGYNSTSIDTIIDPSVVSMSSGGQISTISRPQYKSWAMQFDCITDVAGFNSMISAVGTSNPLVFNQKPRGYVDSYSNPESNTYYASIEQFDKQIIAGSNIKVNIKMREER